MKVKFHIAGADIMEKPLIILWLVVYAFPSLVLALDVAVDYF